ncbi:hypothetical protein LCI18_001589 [Fusarium solani-melongenae]|uniref:Uncharacterized protein n=1 Tax=Fusarium solani subsp. cucurbitae TaxID=2747967 RepID=A0ACD3YP08_FUSSC|nr:hypothetical protein LCI18_001589 [Fusarium solani-melongenae]
MSHHQPNPVITTAIACSFGLRVLFLWLAILGLLESHAWARSPYEVCMPLHMECLGKYAGWKGIPYRCTRPTPEKRECVKKQREKMTLEREAAERKAEQARNLTINIEQVNKDPIIIIHIRVTNNSTMPVTFLNISSPLDRKCSAWDSSTSPPTADRW